MCDDCRKLTIEITALANDKPGEVAAQWNCACGFHAIRKSEDPIPIRHRVILAVISAVCTWIPLTVILGLLVGSILAGAKQ